MSELIDLGWAAGFIDGEGSLSTRTSRTEQPRIAVSNTEFESIHNLQRILGGKIYGPYCYNGYKPYLLWSVEGKRYEEALMPVIEHLVNKKVQAEEALRRWYVAQF